MRAILSWSFSAILFLGCAIAAAADKDKGESPQLEALKNRNKVPAAADIDTAVTLEALLAKTGPDAWPTDKGARLEGHVIQVEQEEDGDMHIVLAAKGGETDTRKWVVVEATPAWRKKNKHLSGSKLHELHGEKVQVLGWLFREPDADSHDPRGTLWELHPVVDLTVVK